MKTLLAFLLSSCGLYAQEKYVTLIVPMLECARNPPICTEGRQILTNRLSVSAGETVHLVSVSHVRDSQGFQYDPSIYFLKDGSQAQARPFNGVWPLAVIAGPVEVQLVGGGAMATFRITPDQYPPDKTVVVPGGPGGANVTMECSTNLVHWTPADNGAYTNLPGVKFFRIKLDRIQP